MEAVHEEVIQIARERARALRNLSSLAEVHARTKMLAQVRANITKEDFVSALNATEFAIIVQLGKELLLLLSEETHEEPEIEGLTRVLIVEGRGGEDDVCSICHEKLEVGDDVRAMDCCHSFHYGCISKWVKKKPTCPLCRYEIPINNNYKRRRFTTTADED